jgi:hypothetical protein
MLYYAIERYMKSNKMKEKYFCYQWGKRFNSNVFKFT